MGGFIVSVAHSRQVDSDRQSNSFAHIKEGEIVENKMGGNPSEMVTPAVGNNLGESTVVAPTIVILNYPCVSRDRGALDNLLS